MNAPAAILPAHLEPHVAALRAMIPDIAGKDLELRCRLLSARETASFALARGSCSEDSAGILEEMIRLATSYAYAALSVDHLERLVAAQRRLLSAVGILDELADLRSGDARG